MQMPVTPTPRQAAVRLSDAIRLLLRSTREHKPTPEALGEVAAILHLAFDSFFTVMEEAAEMAPGPFGRPGDAWNRAAYDALNLRDHFGWAVPDGFDWDRVEGDDDRNIAADGATHSSPGFDQYAETVLDALRSRSPHGMNVGELQLETRLGRNTVYDALSALRASGHARKAGHGRYSASAGKPANASDGTVLELFGQTESGT